MYSRLTQDLADAVENWATNLQDYKSLVDGLLDILEVEEDENKTVSYIVGSTHTAANRQQAQEEVRTRPPRRSSGDDQGRERPRHHAPEGDARRALEGRPAGYSRRSPKEARGCPAVPQGTRR